MSNFKLKKSNDNIGQNNTKIITSSVISNLNHETNEFSVFFSENN